MVLASSFGTQVMAVAVAWEVYDITRNPLDLGLIGLVQFVPVLSLVLVTGIAADRFSRRRILQICLTVVFLCATSLLLFSISGSTNVLWVFATLFVLGIARAFLAPAESSLAPNLVQPVAIGNAVALTSSAWQTSNIVGPVVAGLLYGISPGIAYGTAVALELVALISISMVPKPAQRGAYQAVSMETILAGFRFIFKQKVVFGAISLDLFAVLLGGAVALLPVYARDILHAGPEGLGLLRAAPGIGAILIAVLMSRFPIQNHAGKVLLIFVGLFGLSTLIFGFSNSLWIAVPALFFVGAFDMVSVIIRETIMQLWTPDEVRGRVNAVNSVFIGASNELGEFRAGFMAFLIGAVGAVTIGGAMTMLVAASWAKIFPQLRDVKTLDRPHH